jgi:N utilization substance protein B
VERGGESEQLARVLVAGVQANRGRIDELIAGAAEHWKLPRLSRVDLNLLRLATYELLDRREIPVPVAINEAIEIARRFGSEDSAAFVNGVLDHIAGVLGVRPRDVGGA